ncbi:UDP-glucose 4-epimerase GalE [Clostridia bacterium]|nr:UDP-glucose 4-epimerase GalE [Clostridia bacterium]
MVLVTGGAGYIGSHTLVELLLAGYEVVVLDDLSNSSMQALDRVTEITGKCFDFVKVDLLDIAALEQVFEKYSFDAVIHFAGKKAVGESVEKPLLYYENNVCGTMNLLKMMKRYQVKRMVFSSSATVYGDPDCVPIEESARLQPTNPYGRTKLMIEQILMDLKNSWDDFSVVNLRYFNPIGAHESGKIGENPSGIPNNLLPFVAQVAIGQRDQLTVFGADYPTIDGTGVRDYIHVMDLAKGHLLALKKVETEKMQGLYNLGTGKGYSVLQIVKAFEEASGRKIPFEISARRPGDIAVCYADVTKAREELGFIAQKGLAEMCQDVWRWQENNPRGYTK